jgi:hypothetical protein
VSARYVSMAIESVLMAGFLGLLAWGAATGRPRVDRDSGHLAFAYSGAARFLAISLAIVSVLFCGFVAYKIPINNDKEVIALIGIIGLFCLLAGPLVWEFTRFSIVVSPEGLDFHSPWRPGFFMAWQDVEQVSFGLTCQWFVIRSCYGRKIHVQRWIAGISEFLGELERHLEPALLAKAKNGFRIVERPFPGTGRMG